MKKACLLVTFVMISLFAFSVPAKKGVWKTVKLADGREVKVELSGDEYCKYWRTADGSKLVKNATMGYYEEADMELMVKRAKARREAPAQMRKAMARNMSQESNKISYTGTKKGLIILVQFADTKFKASNNRELYDRIANEVGFVDENLGFKGSVKDYFYDQSYGQMEFDFDVVGPVTLPKSYRYYGQNDSYGNDRYAGHMILEACKAVDEEVDYTVYDWDGDGEVEQIFVVYAGHGEASYNDDDTVWPHQYTISGYTGQRLTLDGVLVDTYACSCELGMREKIDGIGTICHEFSHCLGLPDFYDVQYGGDYGTGEWDIMCSGSYNGDGFSPANYTAYERISIGWLDPVVLKKDTTVTDMQPLAESPEAYIIYNDNYDDEFYVIENRQQTGWDEELPNSGMLIYHVDYDKRIWEYNVPNSSTGQTMMGISNPHERCALIVADNSTGVYNASGDTYPYGKNNSLTNETTPAAKLYNVNADGSLYMNKSLTEITKNSDGTMSFVFENSNVIEGDYELPESYLFYESFDNCNGTGGNDAKFSGSTVGKGKFTGYTDNEGWSSGSAHGALRCAMFGSSSVSGKVTTPELSINGECRLLFKAAPYTGDGTALTIEVAEGNATLSETELVMTENKWTAYEVTVTGTGSVKLQFTAEKRFFFDKVCLTSDSNTGIEDIVDSRINDGRIYSIDGCYMGMDFDRLDAGIYIINGKKVIK